MTTAVTADIFANPDRLRVPVGFAPAAVPLTNLKNSSKPVKVKGEFLKGPIPLP